MAKVSDISVGTFVRYNNELSIVLEYQHRTPGNLRAFYQVKMRAIKNGKLAEARFRPDKDIEIVRVEQKDYQYLYREGDNLVLMDNETYDQVYVPDYLFGSGLDFLQENATVLVAFDGETPVSVEMPKQVVLEIIYTEPGIKGDTATRTLKPATVEGDITVNVPLFCNVGDKIKIDTATGEYVERAK